MARSSSLISGLLLLNFFYIPISAQEIECSTCLGAGSIVLAIFLSSLITLLLIWGGYVIYKKRKNWTDHLTLETDPERGKEKFAIDNPAFIGEPKALEKKLDPTNDIKLKEPYTLKTKQYPSDTSTKAAVVKQVTLRSQDFTGLGFSICGNIKDGIYIKDVRPKGSAHLSGKLYPGDRITSLTINFENIVFDDAVAILSYASPYEVIIEAKSQKQSLGTNSPSSTLQHPIYKSLSFSAKHEKPKIETKTLQNGSSNFKISPSKVDVVPLKSEAPVRSARTKISTPTELTKKHNHKDTSPVTVNDQSVQKPVPLERQKNHIVIELGKNENNIKETDNIKDIRVNTSVDEPDTCSTFDRYNELNTSGIKRDDNGIPQEIPSHLMNAAVAAQRNRKPSKELQENSLTAPKPAKRSKGKAPLPPEEKENSFIVGEKTISLPDVQNINLDQEPINNTKTYLISSVRSIDSNSDSDRRTENYSLVSTISLDSCNITIHQDGVSDKNRKIASTSDLTQINDHNKMNGGKLQRALSLDILNFTTSANLNEDNKAHTIGDMLGVDCAEIVFGKIKLQNKSTLPLVLENLSNLQQSNKWGNLEDIVSKDQYSINSSQSSNLSISESPKQDFYINNISIKPESNNFNLIQKTAQIESPTIPKNHIWPCFDAKPTHIIPPHQDIVRNIISIKPVVSPTTPPPSIPKKPIQNKIWPSVTKIEETKQDNGIISILSKKELHNSVTEIPNTPNETQDKPILFKKVNITNKIPHLADSQSFLNREKLFSLDKSYERKIPEDDINIPDDIKVSRHTLNNLDNDSKSVDQQSKIPELSIKIKTAKKEDGIELNETNQESEIDRKSLDSIDGKINFESKNKSPKFKTNIPLKQNVENRNNSEININNVKPITISETQLSYAKVEPTIANLPQEEKEVNDNKEVTSIPQIFTSKLNANIERKKNEATSPKLFSARIDINAEQQMHKIHEIVDQQLKNLPEIKTQDSISFKGSNESSPQKSPKPDLLVKSRIPVSTTKLSLSPDKGEFK